MLSLVLGCSFSSDSWGHHPLVFLGSSKLYPPLYFSGLSDPRVPEEVKYFPCNVLGFYTWISGQKGPYLSFQICWTQEIDVMWSRHRIWSKNYPVPICFCHSPHTGSKISYRPHRSSTCIYASFFLLFSLQSQITRKLVQFLGEFVSFPRNRSKNIFQSLYSHSHFSCLLHVCLPCTIPPLMHQNAITCLRQPPAT